MGSIGSVEEEDESVERLKKRLLDTRLFKKENITKHSLAIMIGSCGLVRGSGPSSDHGARVVRATIAGSSHHVSHSHITLEKISEVISRIHSEL